MRIIGLMYNSGLATNQPSQLNLSKINPFSPSRSQFKCHSSEKFSLTSPFWAKLGRCYMCSYSQTSLHHSTCLNASYMVFINAVMYVQALTLPRLSFMQKKPSLIGFPLYSQCWNISYHIRLRAQPIIISQPPSPILIICNLAFQAPAGSHPVHLRKLGIILRHQRKVFLLV